MKDNMQGTVTDACVELMNSRSVCYFFLRIGSFWWKIFPLRSPNGASRSLLPYITHDIACKSYFCSKVIIAIKGRDVLTESRASLCTRIGAVPAREPS